MLRYLLLTFLLVSSAIAVDAPITANPCIRCTQTSTTSDLGLTNPSIGLPNILSTLGCSYADFVNLQQANCNTTFVIKSGIPFSSDWQRDKIFCATGYWTTK